MLKKLLILSLILALALCLLPASAAAAAPSRQEIQNAITDKLDSLWTGSDQGLPFISAVDIDGDGIMEYVFDESYGRQGTDLVRNRSLEWIGAHIRLLNGPCTVAYWNRAKGRAETIRMKNDSMFVAFNAQEHCLVTSTSSGTTETYYILRITDRGAQLDIYTQRYNSEGYIECTKNGKAVEYGEVSWEMESCLYNAMAISFAMYS